MSGKAIALKVTKNAIDRFNLLYKRDRYVTARLRRLLCNVTSTGSNPQSQFVNEHSNI